MPYRRCVRVAVVAVAVSLALTVLMLTPVRRGVPGEVVAVLPVPGVVAMVLVWVVTRKHAVRWSDLPRWTYVVSWILPWAFIVGVLAGGTMSYSSGEGREKLEAFAPWWAFAGAYIAFRAVLTAWAVTRRARTESWGPYHPRTGG